MAYHVLKKDPSIVHLVVKVYIFIGVSYTSISGLDDQKINTRYLMYQPSKVSVCL